MCVSPGTLDGPSPPPADVLWGFCAEVLCSPSLPTSCDQGLEPR